MPSPADDLRALLAQEPQTAREWGERQAAIERHVTAHGPSWLALLDAAQELISPSDLVYDSLHADHAMAALAAAVAALTAARP